MSKLIYITCPGHSGSTILDLLIGTLPNTFSTGELMWFPWGCYRNLFLDEEQSVLKQNICTCRSNYINCEIWSKVISSIYSKTGVDMLKNPLDFNISFDSRQKYIDKYSLRQKIYDKLYYLFPKLTSPLLKKKYKDRINKNWILFDSISEVSNCEYVIDSSKYPKRLSLLSKERSEDIYVIVLVREVFGQASSGINYGKKIDVRKQSKSWLQFYNNKLAKVLKHKNLKKLIVSYEDLVMSPDKVRTNIAKFINIEEEATFINKLFPANNHLIAGNPIRYKDQIIIKHDQTWKEYLNKAEIEYLVKVNHKLLPEFKCN